MLPTKNRRGVCLAAASALLASALPAPLHAQAPLVTGKRITLPPLGTQTPVGSLPMNMILTPDGRYAVSSDMGFRQLLTVLDTTTGGQVSTLEFGSPATRSQPGLYFGLAASPAAGGGYTLYASQGNTHTVAVFSLSATGALSQTGTVVMPFGDFPTGVALDGRGDLYVAVSQTYLGTIADATTPSSLVVYNTAAAGVVTPGVVVPTAKAPGTPAVEASRFYFGATPGTANPAGSTPNYLYAVAALSSGSKVYVTSQRDDAVFVLNTSNPSAPTLSKTLSVGATDVRGVPSGTQAHPVALLLNRAQTRLYVAYAHADGVAVVDTGADGITGRVSLRPAGATDLAGATPTALALSPDDKTLYATLGDMNAVAVVDAGSLSVQGHIPTGWYPSAVVASPFRKQILVANAKGTSARNPNPAFVYQGGNGDPNYGLYLTVGSVSTIPVPNSVTLRADTQQVLANNGITATTSAPPNPLAGIGLQAGKIKHVIYIVKENRTYDQVLGDLPQGNGEPALTIFGASVTPNQHALASRFVLLDNFYDCGEASGDGWPWSTQGQANEYVIKNLPYNYSGRGRNYDFEGSNNNYPTGGFPALDPYGSHTVGPDSPFYAAGGPAVADVAEAPGGHIWDDVERSGLSFRNYGGFTSFGVGASSDLLLPSNFPGGVGLLPVGTIPAADGSSVLGRMGRTDFDMRGYDQNFADSDAPQTYYNQTGDPKNLFGIRTFGHYNSTSRVSEFNRELTQMLAADPTGGAVPNFILLKYSNDHTQGFRNSTPASGTTPAFYIHSPQSAAADNDYAVGQTVDLISKSALWQSTAVFVIEDDSQDGPDHVDSHRSTCYVVSPYIKKNSVDHTFYNTDSVLKTMEQLLGLPPMSQYDAVANTILDFDTTASNSAPYTATLPAQSIIGSVNPFPPAPMAVRRMTAAQRQKARLARLSDAMDFVHPDSAPAQLLNEIVWKSVRGVNSRMPAPVHNTGIEARLHLPKTAAGKTTAARDGDE